MYLFFDTETTGLSKNWKAPVSAIDNWPRLVQIAWIVCDEEGAVLEEKDFIIKPENFTIPAEASNVHRITTERASAEGKDLEQVLILFSDQVHKADCIVAHNINFDEKIVGAEFIRKNISSTFYEKPHICTMQKSTDYCKIPGPYGYKWPKLSELHVALFGKDFEEAHDASADIQATKNCFWKMKELGLV